jgi:hypothetical protein
MKVMVPHNLLVWVVVDVDKQKVTDVWASDLVENYTLDKSGDEVFALWESSELLEGRDDPVDRTTTAQAVQVVENAWAEREIQGNHGTFRQTYSTWPHLRIEESAR